MDITVFVKRAYAHDSHSQFVSNENPRRYENLLVIADALAKLPPLQRLIVEMWSLGFTQEAIAEHLDMSRSVVGYRIRSGVEFLKKELEGVLL